MSRKRSLPFCCCWCSCLSVALRVCVSNFLFKNAFFFFEGSGFVSFFRFVFIYLIWLSFSSAVFFNNFEFHERFQKYEYCIIESQSLEDSMNGSLPVDNKLIRVWAMFPNVIVAGCFCCGSSRAAVLPPPPLLLFIVIWFTFFRVHSIYLFTFGRSVFSQ